MTPETSAASRVEEVSNDDCDRKIREVMERIEMRVPGLAEELRDWVWLRHGVIL